MTFGWQIFLLAVKIFSATGGFRKRWWPSMACLWLAIHRKLTRVRLLAGACDWRILGGGLAEANLAEAHVRGRWR